MKATERDYKRRRWNEVLAELFAIDPRSMAVFRMALGALLLFDVFWRWPDLEAMYADGGIMPVDKVQQLFEGTWRWSLHWLDGSIEFQAAMFGLMGFLAFCLLVGFQTRLATLGCWILLMSLQTRAPLVINAGDSLMRLLLFWGFFLPLDRVWSLDARQRIGRGDSELQPVVSMGTVAIILQICIVYWFTAVFKLLYENWIMGEGLLNAVAWGGYNKPLGDYLLGHAKVTTLLSHATLVLELVGPALLFVPWGTRYLRMLVVAAFFAFHIGIESCMYVGLFSYVSMAAWTLLLPGLFWDRVVRRRERHGLASMDTATDAALDDLAVVPASRWQRFRKLAADAVCLVFFLFMVTYNVYGLLGRSHDLVMPKAIKRIGDVTLLKQQWSMFARPMLVTNWFVAEARLKDGRRVDLLRDGADVDYTRPARIALLYPNHRWRKFCINLTNPHAPFEPFRQTLVDYLMRRWNARHEGDQQAVVVDLWCLFEKVTAGERTGEYQREIYARRELETANIEDTIDFDVFYESDRQAQPSDETGP